MSNNLQKLILQILVIASVTILAIFNVLEGDTISMIVGTIVGYAFYTIKDVYANKE